MKEVKNKAKGGHLNELTWVNHILQFVSLEQNFSELVNAVIQGCKRKKSKHEGAGTSVAANSGVGVLPSALSAIF